MRQDLEMVAGLPSGEWRAPPIDFYTVMASVGINLLALALPLALLQIFDRVVPNRSTETLVVLFTGLMVALALDLTLKICRIILLGQASERLETVLSDQVCSHMLYADAHAFSSMRSSTHMERFNAIYRLRDYFGGQGRLLAIDLPFAAIFVIMIGLIGGPLIVVPIGAIACLLAAAHFLRRLQRPALAARQSIDQRKQSFITEALGQVLTVKCLAVEEQLARRFELLQKQSADSTRQLSVISGLSQTFGAIFGQVCVAALAVVGGYLVIVQRIGIAELAACMLLNGRTVQPILKILSLWVQIENVSAAREALRGIRDVPLSRPAKSAPTLSGHIVFDDVSVRIGQQDRLLFEHLSFEVKPGSCFAIDGEDGSGKSTALRLILGEQAPSSGKVTIDGHNPVDLIGCRALNQLAYVDRDPPVFSGTLLENMSLFGSDEERERAIEAARSIGLLADINRLPFGLDTQVSPNSAEFASNGLIQRIAIARALSRRPKLLLFNEANTALDFEADQKLLAQLRRLRGNTTLVLVSRRPSFLALADCRISTSLPQPKREALAEWENDLAAESASDFSPRVSA